MSGALPCGIDDDGFAVTADDLARRQDHCWHHGGLTYASNPPQWDERCCYCGGVRRVIGATERDERHGPFVDVQRSARRYRDEPDAPCPGRVEP